MENSGKEYLLSMGSYGKIIALSKDRVRKDFKDWKIFLTELFYLALTRNMPNFCQLEDTGPRWISMKRYQYDLSLLSGELPYSKRMLLTNRIIHQMLLAVSFLHRRGISHNDINIKNIFCDYNDGVINCYLGDFSVALMNNLRVNFSRESIYYDIYESCDNKEKDVYALGATIVHFLTKKCSCEELNYKHGWRFKDRFPDYQLHDYTLTFLNMALSPNRKVPDKVIDIEMGNKLLTRCKSRLAANITFVGLARDLTRVIKTRDPIYYCTTDELWSLFSHYGRDILDWLLVALEEYKK